MINCSAFALDIHQSLQFSGGYLKVHTTNFQLQAKCSQIITN